MLIDIIPFDNSNKSIAIRIGTLILCRSEVSNVIKRNLYRRLCT